ncbi:DMT family transporter [Thioclava sp. A2]|uniref:DMT family transporter n=1 Tax=Thioclava sp. FCG-A2 TaxID=3080562 RepID=UPI002953027F|nr:DMT family transporter [Thioclava sp. A2]MDV7270015.1 DMT family transporter [Thioclava sp. A2]
MTQSRAEQPMKLGLLGVLTLALPPLFWAGNFIVARAARGEVPPVALSYGRWLIAFLCLLPFAIGPIRRDWPLYRAHWKRVALISVPGVLAFNSLVYLGLQYTAATNGMLLNSTIPVLILVLGALFWHQSLGAMQGIGLAVSTFGVAVVILHGEWARLVALEVSQGDLIIFAAMVCWAIYTMWLRFFPVALNRIGFLTAQIAVTLVLLLPFLLWEVASGRVPVWSPASFGALVYVGIVPSVLAYLLYMRGVAIAGPARAGLFIHLLPVYGAVLSTLFLGEALEAYHAVGFAAILGGILIASRASRTA